MDRRAVNKDIHVTRKKNCMHLKYNEAFLNRDHTIPGADCPMPYVLIAVGVVREVCTAHTGHTVTFSTLVAYCCSTML